MQHLMQRIAKPAFLENSILTSAGEPCSALGQDYLSPAHKHLQNGTDEQQGHIGTSQQSTLLRCARTSPQPSRLSFNAEITMA